MLQIHYKIILSLFLHFAFSLHSMNITHKATCVDEATLYTKKVWMRRKKKQSQQHSTRYDTIRYDMYLHDHHHHGDDDGNGWCVCVCVFLLLNTEFNEFCYVYMYSITKWLACVSLYDDFFCVCEWAVCCYLKL